MSSRLAHKICIGLSEGYIRTVARYISVPPWPVAIVDYVVMQRESAMEVSSSNRTVTFRVGYRPGLLTSRSQDHCRGG